MPVEAVLTPVLDKGHLLEQAQEGSTRLVAVVHRDGQERTLALTVSCLNCAGTPGPVRALVFRDATEEAAAQRLRAYFLANISHEFRTPLSALKASVELLLEEIENLSKAETIELVKSLHFSVTSLQTLIDNLLESVSIEAGRFRIRPRPTDLKLLIADTGNLLRPLLERRNQALVVRLPDGLPRANVDPMRLTQVLVNLISNASKYGPLDKPIELDVAFEPEGGLKFSVSDQGSGVAPEERANIFRRFVRLDDEKDKAQYGVGLGLSVVKAIVEGHGGRVGLDGRSGGGSVFWFTLPLED